MLGPSSCPYSPECVEGEFLELPLYGVLRSSPHPRNHKQQQRYAVCVMQHNARACYRASQQRSEALKRVPAKVGTHGAWGASGATGYRAEIPYGEA